MGRRGYPAEFRRKVLDLVQAGRNVADVARDLDISSETIYAWRRQDRIDQGLAPGLTSTEKTELAAANKRIAELDVSYRVCWRLRRVPGSPPVTGGAVSEPEGRPPCGSVGCHLYPCLGRTLVSGVLVMSGSGLVYKRCGCRGGGSSKAREGRCSGLARRGHGSWYFTLDLEHTPGGRRRLRRGGFVSREAAREGLRQARELEGIDTDPAVLTLAQWLERWLATRTRLRPLTRTSYAEHIHRYLTPHLGAVPLEELTPALVQEAFEQIRRRTTPAGEQVSAATVQRIRATLRAALNTAVREGLLPFNPAQGLRLDPGAAERPVVWTEQAVAEWAHGGVRPAVAVWTVEQTRHFLHHVSEHRLYALFHLAVMTGLRRGEVVGLRWPDIDLVGGTVRVVRQLQCHRGGLVELAPKSAASRRMVALDHTTLGVLRRHQWYQQNEAESQGRVWDPRGWVFMAVRGGPMAPDRLSRLFRTLNSESGLPPVRLHDLRHGAATLALAAGVELKVVQAMLGHASIVLTADTYSSVLPQVAREAAERTAWLVLRDAGRTHRRGSARRVNRGLVPSRSHPGPISRGGRFR